MNPDDYLVEHCMCCDRPVTECKNQKHKIIRTRYGNMVLDASIIKGSC